MSSKILMCLAFAATFAVQAQETAAAKRLNAAAVTVKEIMEAGDKGIPQDLLDSSSCVVIVPGLKKGAFIFGGKYGRGFLTCRNENGVGWKSPASIRVEGGSFGFQIGGSETDVVMIVKSQRGAEKMMQSRFTLGGEASVAGGPVGRNSTAMTDVQMRAEILSYSRSRGAFAGISLEGATVREDQGANRELYGRDISSKDVISTQPPIPAGAQPLLDVLSKYSGRAGK